MSERGAGGPGGLWPHAQGTDVWAHAALASSSGDHGNTYEAHGYSVGDFPPEHGNRFNFDQQIGAAENRLDAGGSRQRIESLLFVECGALLVEGLVVALDVAQVAGGAHDVVPGRAFRSQQLGDVVEGAAELGAEIANVDGAAGIVDAGGARDQQDGEAVQIDPHAAGKGAAVVVGFVQRRVIGDCPLHDRGCGHFRE